MVLDPEISEVERLSTVSFQYASRATAIIERSYLLSATTIDDFPIEVSA